MSKKNKQIFNNSYYINIFFNQNFLRVLFVKSKKFFLSPSIFLKFGATQRMGSGKNEINFTKAIVFSEYFVENYYVVCMQNILLSVK